MPEVVVDKKVTVTLKLTEDEARILRGMMQNPMNGVNPAREEQEQANLRTALFRALSWGESEIRRG